MSVTPLLYRLVSGSWIDLATVRGVVPGRADLRDGGLPDRVIILTPDGHHVIHFDTFPEAQKRADELGELVNKARSGTP